MRRLLGDERLREERARAQKAFAWPEGTGWARVSALLLAEAVLFAILLPAQLHRHILWAELTGTAIFLPAVFVLSRTRLDARRTAALIIGAGAVFQIIAVTTPPKSSDDDFRYVWDAKVQLAGVDPYRYAPTAPQLEHLRDGFLFPDRDPCPWPVADGCSAINRPGVHTIYPPVAEAAFAVMRVISIGGHGNHLPLQIAAALGTILVSWLLVRRRLALDRPLWTVALWAWCPLTVVEFGNGAHIDWLAITLVVLALRDRRATRAGALAGAAIATKVYPVLILPALLRRRPLAVLGAAVATVALVYVPHVLAVGTKVLGYLPAYLRDEHYTNGQRFLLLDPVLPPRLATVAAAVALGLAAWWVARHAKPDVPEDTAVVMAGVAMVVTTPDHGWYAGLLLALIGMSGAVEWLPVALVAGLVYLTHSVFAPPLVAAPLMYVAALLATVAVRFRLRTVPPHDQQGVAVAGTTTTPC